MDIEQLEKDTAKNLERSKQKLLIIFFSGLGILFMLILVGPSVSDEQREILMKIPSTPSDFADLISVVKVYVEDRYFYVLTFFSFLFIFLQSFGIPGPLILSVISGALFGLWTALAIVTLCSTIGSFFCYLLSETLGKGFVVRMFPDTIVSINRRVAKNKTKIFYYLLFLRLTPIVPNWFINLSAPIIGIPKIPFVVAVFFGLIPANFIFISSGITISNLDQMGLDNQSIAFLLCLGVVALIPTYIARRHKEEE